MPLLPSASSCYPTRRRARLPKTPSGSVGSSGPATFSRATTLAELSHLPVSGIARIESFCAAARRIPHAHHPADGGAVVPVLPGLHLDATAPQPSPPATLRQGDRGFLDASRFPQVVMELDHQLSEWRRVLPPAFSFTVGFDGHGGVGGPTMTEHGGFLRQRYLTCRSVIYRPYLMWVLSGAGLAGFGDGTAGGGSVTEDVLANCKACIDACLLHILNLRGSRRPYWWTRGSARCRMFSPLDCDFPQHQYANDLSSGWLPLCLFCWRLVAFLRSGTSSVRNYWPLAAI